MLSILNGSLSWKLSHIYYLHPHHRHHQPNDVSTRPTWKGRWLAWLTTKMYSTTWTKIIINWIKSKANEYKQTALSACLLNRIVFRQHHHHYLSFLIRTSSSTSFSSFPLFNQPSGRSTIIHTGKKKVIHPFINLDMVTLSRIWFTDASYFI